MFPLKKIVCPSDFSDGSLQALTYATELALKFESELYLVHVLPEPTTGIEVEGEVPIEADRLICAEAEERLSKLAESLKTKGLQTHVVIDHGDTAVRIVGIAKDAGASLIVIATHGTTGWRHLAFGSVTEKVVRLAMCPVLTIRMGAAQAMASQAA